MCLGWVSTVNDMFEVLTVNEMQPIRDILSVLQMTSYTMNVQFMTDVLPLDLCCSAHTIMSDTLQKQICIGDHMLVQLMHTVMCEKCENGQ